MTKNPPDGLKASSTKKDISPRPLSNDKSNSAKNLNSAEGGKSENLASSQSDSYNVYAEPSSFEANNEEGNRLVKCKTIREVDMDYE